MLDYGDTMRLELGMKFFINQFVRDVVKTYAMGRKKLALQEK